MRASAVAGIIFANTNDDSLKKLTSHRSMASVPFGARYRLIDFSLSNLVNAGITNIGIITKEKYRSLMDHVGSGYYWDLDRKNGGLHLLPPYLTSGVKHYNQTVDALYSARDFIKRSQSEYFVLYNADILANIDISEVIEYHISNNADVTFVYSKSDLTEKDNEAMVLTLDDKNAVSKIEFKSENAENINRGMGITVISRDLLIKLVSSAFENDLADLYKDVIANKVKQLKILGFEHKEFVATLNSTKNYFKANMDLLNPEVRHQLFNSKRPIFTKTRDDMPTRYGINAKVKNCIIADGCIIGGTVKNSILSRGVKIEKGAVVENCILMQETVVGKDANLYNVIADKNAVIGESMVLKGTNEKKFFVKKNQII